LCSDRPQLDEKYNVFLKMKFLATFIAFVVTVAGTAIDKRQLAGLFGGALAKPDKITETKPRTRNNAKRSLIRWGPFELPAANVSLPTPISFVGLDQY
jgi:hypothetical protein